MTLKDVKEYLEAEVLCGQHWLDRDVKSCFACDMISEMLLYVTSGALLITSLTNAHVLHTAQVMDACGVVFVGGKKPDQSFIEESDRNNIPLLSTRHLVFQCCGLLYSQGLQGISADEAP